MMASTITVAVGGLMAVIAGYLWGGWPGFFTVWGLVTVIVHMPDTGVRQ